MTDPVVLLIFVSTKNKFTMRTLMFLAMLLFPALLVPAYAQDYAPSDTVPKELSVVIKNDGTEFVGVILKQDAREVLIRTEKTGEVVIPKHEIKDIKKVQQGNLTSSGAYIPEEIFATRYFITTNGLPLNKDDSYIIWNLYGPDFQFSLGNHFTAGMMSSWVGIPIIGTFKYATTVSPNVHLGVGTLLGTGSWIKPDFLAGLPFGTITLGNRRSNISFSTGYAFYTYEKESDGRALVSVAGMAKVSPKVSLVLDSFILIGQSELFGNGALFIPGVRWATSKGSAFQLGFAGLVVEGEPQAIAIPMIQWFRQL